MSSCSAVASSVRLNQPNQFASSSSPRTRTPAKPAPRACALEVGGTKACTSTTRLERVVVGRVGRRRRRSAPGARRTARRHSGAAARPARFGTAAIRSPWRDGSPAKSSVPPGPQHARELGERAVELGQVVQHRVAEHEVEATRPRTAARRRRTAAVSTLEPEPARVALAARRACRARCRCRSPRAIDAVLQQVEREVAGAGADLERARERPGLRPEQLRRPCRAPARGRLAEVDAPLGVVVGRRDVVVAAVDVEDLVGLAGAAMARRSLGRGPRPRLAARSRRARRRVGSAVQPPLPGAARGARLVHARLAAEPEHVLRLHHRHRAGEENASAIRAHQTSALRPAAGRRRPARARAAGSDSYQPRSVSLSCVPV